MAKILVVDDEPVIRDSLSNLLSDALGHTVETAETEQDAIAIARRMRPDLLIVDWMLGDNVDGARVATSLREVDPSLPVIMLTGHLLDDVRTKMSSLPRTWLLPKPCEHELLLNAIDIALQPPDHRAPESS